MTSEKTPAAIRVALRIREQKAGILCLTINLPTHSILMVAPNGCILTACDAAKSKVVRLPALVVVVEEEIYEAEMDQQHWRSTCVC